MAKKVTGSGGKPKKVRVPGPAASGKSEPAPLASLRERIDAIDLRLVELLNERASLVVKVGESKRATGVPIYAPHREAQVLKNVLSANKGPLGNRAVEAIYREMMSGSFALEQPLRIGYLGPPGSYSHLAATRHFGSSVAFEDLHEIRGVFTEVRRGHVDYGLVPIENSTGGGIAESLDAFLDGAGEISIYAEVQLSVRHCLLANSEPKDVRRIHSKPEALAQCRGWLSTQYPGVELIASASTSKAAQAAAEECRLAVSIGAVPGSAAVGSELAGPIYGLNLLFRGIEDNPNNVTRFVVISRQKAKRSGDDKTSLMFKTADKPGALVEVLNVLARQGINLSHIDKRPSGRTNWEYTFFVDLLGHQDDEGVARGVAEAMQHCRELVVLGSYPRSQRIL